MSSNAPKTKRGADRRETLLRAAERVIGARGFAAASIAGITRECGAALGTFYIYFPSKEAVFRELVEEMGRLTRRAMSEASAGAPDRLEAEKRGLRAFLGFVAERPSLYLIVEEARFADPAAYRAYFRGFAEAYAARLERAAAAGEIRPGDSEVRAWALMGIAKSLGDRVVLAETPPDLDRMTEEGFALIRDGLAP